jgi:excinuclease UvrABC nuclease subunit
MTTRLSWRDLYAAAMLELDHASLKGRIKAAQAAIRQAMQRSPNNLTHGAAEEVQDIAAALGNLQSLQRVEFRKSAPACCEGFPPAEGL